MATEVFLALGSNLGDSIQILKLASAKLANISKSKPILSSIWRSVPEGFSKKVPDFFNAVACLSVEISAEVMLSKVLSLEKRLGRERDNKLENYSSRSIDIDIVDFGGLIYRSETLILPHPRAHKRQFVLRPLQEIKPDFHFPHLTVSLEELICRAEDNKMERVSQLIPLE